MYDSLLAPALLQQALLLAPSDPKLAAEYLEELGRRVLGWAARLRAGSPWIAEPGMGTQARVQVVGPDGQVRQDVTVNG